MGFWSGTLYGLWGSAIVTGGAITALSSGDIVLKVAGTVVCVGGTMVAYSGLVEDTLYENISPQRLIYKGLRELYKKLKG